MIWRLVSIVLPAENTAKVWLTRLGYLVSAVTYSLLAWSAVTIARHQQAAGSTESEDAKVERLTRELMEKTGGRWLVGAIGVVLVAVGLYFVIKGITGEVPRRAGARRRRPVQPRSDRHARARSDGSGGAS